MNRGRQGRDKEAGSVIKDTTDPEIIRDRVGQASPDLEDDAERHEILIIVVVVSR
jgi:hypothetical protein